MKYMMISVVRMKKMCLLSLTMLVFNFYSSAQFSLNSFFFYGDSKNAVTDTFFNKREVIVKTGIKQVTITEISSQKKIPLQIINFNKNGYVEKTKTCFYKKSSDEIGSCIIDTLIYDTSNRNCQTITYNGNGSIGMHEFISYLTKREINDSFYTVHTKDSVIGYLKDSIQNFLYQNYKTYNNRGQVVKSKKIQPNGDVLEDAIFYYGSDNLLDSARDTQSHSIFKKFVKGNDKIVEAVIYHLTFMNNYNVTNCRWVYNASSQCIESRFINNRVVRIVGGKPEYEKSHNYYKYYYNPNGTLSKITSSKSDKKQESVINYVYYDSNGKVIE